MRRKGSATILCDIVPSPLKFLQSKFFGWFSKLQPNKLG
jgi:hypothetical protein